MNGNGQDDPGSIGVCLASLSFYPLYAGPALRFQRYAPGLAQRGARISVLTQAVTEALIERDGSIAGGDGERRPASDFPSFEVVDGLPVHRVTLPTGWRREPAFFRRLADFCEQQRPPVDVVQLVNVDLFSAPWLLRLRRRGVRTVFTHTLLGDLSPARWKRALQRVHRRLPLELVDVVVVSSQEMRDRLAELGMARRVEVIPNGVNLGRFRPAAGEAGKATLRRDLGLQPDWDVIVAVGPIIPRKGTDALVEAFVGLAGDHPRARLVLVGPRHDLARNDLAEFHGKLQSLIDGAGVADRVIFTGAVDNVQAYLQAADLLVFPSRREGMPNVVPEAMATGVPVVMTPFIGLPAEFGIAGTHYILADWAPERLGAEMRSLLDDPARRRQLGEAGREWIAATMDVERSLDAYMALYRRLKAGAPALR